MALKFEEILNQYQNIITGTDANETFRGYKGDNIYYGKNGGDTYRDYSGSDTYLYKKGDGYITIQDSVGTDSVLLSEGISTSDFIIEQYNNNLHIKINGTNEGFNIIDWFRREDSKIEQFVFSDGTIVTKDDIDNAINSGSNTVDASSSTEPEETPTTSYDITGTDSRDYLTGTVENNVIYGKKGDDVITDNKGDETYIFNKGDGSDFITDIDGNDKIQFGTGITKENLEFSNENQDLVINFNNSSDKITINDWFNNETHKIESLKFSDNTTLSKGDIDAEFLENITPDLITGTDKYDYIQGHTGDNAYYAKQGNDIIRDFYGNETYVFNFGDGMDTVRDFEGYDVIKFGSDLSSDNLELFRYENNLHVCFKGTNDKIDVLDWFGDSRYRIEKLEFADGKSLGVDDIINMTSDMPVIIGSSSNDEIITGNAADVVYGVSGNDYINAKDGSDLIYAGGGNDTVQGGGGNDRLIGEVGDDFLLGGDGNDYYQDYWYLDFDNDTIQDNSGQDVLEVKGFNSNNVQFSSLDMDSNGKIDGLKLTFDDENSISILDYFNNSSSSIESAARGDGYIESIQFNDTNIDIGDVHNILA